MPFGMGPAGWFMLPYFYPYYGYGGYFPWYGFSPFGYLGGDELSYLKQIKHNLERQLQDINARIAELEKQ